ncbi:MAG: flagellar hook capping protein [Lachnospiraceae bacterium]|nr:flagellar hook capping protein [Lachnospiraceae bacterium]
MAVSAVIENGEIVTSATQNSLSSTTTSGSSDSVKKEDFLQLLVAQMKYQDPMEPTENTEWVTQYAQFTQVEELQGMSSNMALSRASTLVGQTVIMDVAGADGSTTEVQGNVDYVSYEGGKAYLSINGELYSMDDLKNVVDNDYLTAMKNSAAFVEALGNLPDLSTLTLADKAQVEEAASIYNNLTDWEKNLLGSDEFKAKLDEYTNRMSNLIAIAEEE